MLTQSLFYWRLQRLVIQGELMNLTLSVELYQVEKLWFLLVFQQHKDVIRLCEGWC